MPIISYNLGNKKIKKLTELFLTITHCCENYVVLYLVK